MESDLISLPARKGKRTDRPASIAEMAAQQVLGQMQRWLPQVVASLGGEYQSDRAEVGKDEYMAMRKWSLDKPEKVQQWAAQVGPSTFLKELWEATDTPKEWQEKYLEAIEGGVPHVDAMKYADVNTLPPPPVEPVPYYSPQEQIALSMIPPPPAVNEQDLAPIPGEPMLMDPAMVAMPPSPLMTPAIPPEELMAQPGEPMLAPPMMGG